LHWIELVGGVESGTVFSTDTVAVLESVSTFEVSKTCATTVCVPSATE